MIQIVLLIFLFILLSIYANIEVSYHWSHPIGIENKKKLGIKSARLLSEFSENASRYMHTHVLAWFISLLAWVACVYVFFVTHFKNKFSTLSTAGLLMMVVFLIVFILTFLFIRFLFKKFPEHFLSIFYYPLRWTYTLLSPLSAAFENLAAFVLKYLFNFSIEKNTSVYKPIELDHYEKQVRTGKEESENDINVELFENALALSNIRVRECLIPRNEIVGLDIQSTREEIKKLFLESKHSRILIFENSLDKILGYIHHLDFFKPDFKFPESLHSIPAIPEAMNAVELLNQLTKEHKSMAWVVDEFGGTAGIITMEDVLEEIFGEIEDEHDESEYVEKQISKNEYILSGRLEVEYINEKFHLDIPTEFAETLSGYIVEEHNAIPLQNEKIVLGPYEFNILMVSKTRIETVKLKVLSEED